MAGRILKMVAYTKAPLKTFMVMHPLRALKWGAAYMVVKTALELRRKPV